MIFSLSLLAASAWAQDAVTDGATPSLNVQTFRPSMDSHEFFRAIDTDLGERGFAARGVASYTLAPLQYTYADGTTVDIVSNLLQLDAIGAYTIGRFRIGVDLPVILRAFGGTEADATGLGDLAIDGKVRLLDNTTAPLGFALSARTWLPTSTAGGALATNGVGFEAVASLDKPIGQKLDAVLDIGVSYQPAIELENVTWGTTANLQAGLAYRATDRVGVVGELYTAGVLADLGNAKARPTELLVGGWYRAGERRALAIRPGLAIGLNDAVTTPKLRALLGVAWDPLAPKAAPDRDKDGVADATDTCPDVPEDVDGFEDTDGCAELARLTVKVLDTDGVAVDGAEWTIASATRTGKTGESTDLPAGPYTVASLGVTASAEVPPGGAASVEIRVPAPRGTLAVTIVDTAGKPVAGAMWSAAGPTPVAETAAGEVKARPGAYKLTGGAPGYRSAKAEIVLVKDGTATLKLELLPSKAALQKEKIEIKDSVYFETGKAIIKTESYALLDEVAEILKDHPELSKLSIEGHTDSRGNDKANLQLSQSRAESVRTYLVGKGVAVERLDATGYGETKPLVAEKTAADQARNRRVTFVVTGRTDGDVAGPTKVIETTGDAPKDK
ncbi:MAG: OmpA family protein [Pseudomonadota bacterium]|nr:OmpA family protein [Pseudomonadota bacterium]